MTADSLKKPYCNQIYWSMKLQRIQSENLQQHEQKWTPAPQDYVDERWTQFKIAGKNITSRSHHTSVVYKGKLYIYGGYNTDKGVLSDFNELNLQSMENFRWKELSSQSKSYPGKLRNHSAVIYKSKMVMFGGQNEENRSTNKMWVYDFSEESWSIKYSDIKVENLDSHASVVEGQTMYVFGGFRDQEAAYSNTLYAVDLETFKWKVLNNGKSKTQISPRASMSLIHYNNSLWVFGGIDNNSTFGDFWKFDLHKLEWSRVESKNTPEARRSHSMIVYQNSFWMFGGIQDVTKEKNDINIYTPATEAWTKIMNTSNLVYECSPTMKSRSKGAIKRKNSPKKESIKPSNKLSLLAMNNQKSGELNHNEGMKRILQENRQKKFLQRKNQLLKQFSQKTIAISKRQLSPISESMLKTLQLIGEQQPNHNILHGQITYDPTNRFIIGKKPCARDAHTCILFNHKMLIFGGDRHLMCFSDVYYFDLKKGIESKILYQRDNVVLKKL